jgi:hypothetical protein
LILDPFVGSGTTGRVCDKLGRYFVGYDLLIIVWLIYLWNILNNKIMTKLYVFCSDLNTKKICDKYSDNGLIYHVSKVKKEII